jgi:sialic acid synthase SpsE/mannose-6-phosphate isomerase-like protein (cupin superfamily)
VKNLFKDLFILDLANNHFGSVKHGVQIINDYGKIIRKNKIKATIKFQFRNLDNFIHPAAVKSNDKYVKRFLSTRISNQDFKNLFNAVKKNKLLTSCTPFDEDSVNLIEKMKFDLIKIASVSSVDFNLLERVAKNNIPKIISTGGKTLSEIDKIVSFFKKKKQNFALMHCISIYPSENYHLQILFIKKLKERYRDIEIGWSTHENPNEYLPACLAYACGARIFEKHIGITSSKYSLNNYSITPKLFEEWLGHLKKSKDILGTQTKKIEKKELEILNSLQRGVYARKKINSGEILTKKHIYFAIPLKKGQLSSDQFKKNTKIKKNLIANASIQNSDVEFDQNLLQEYKIRSHIHELKAILNYNKIDIGEKFDMEISHHKGIDNFKKTGCFLFNIINKLYAKKMIVMLPYQKHPLHFHKKKNESFHVVSGSLNYNLNGKRNTLRSGQILHIKKNSWHEFQAGKEGCIFDEISTTSFRDDSFYRDKKIKLLNRDDRKTYVNQWL